MSKKRSTINCNIPTVSFYVHSTRSSILTNEEQNSSPWPRDHSSSRYPHVDLWENSSKWTNKITPTGLADEVTARSPSISRTASMNQPCKTFKVSTMCFSGSNWLLKMSCTLPSCQSRTSVGQRELRRGHWAHPSPYAACCPRRSAKWRAVCTSLWMPAIGSHMLRYISISP